MIEPSPDQPRITKVPLTLRIRKQAPLIVSVFVLCIPCLTDASTCYGSVGNGRLSNGVQLPAQGDNFVVYSVLGIELGRTYVHGLVRQAVLDSYANVQKTMPNKVYVYGETGFAHGGPIRPHRTHQAGLSVDFMVPVLNDANRSVPLPSTPLNKFGYGVEFDDQGRILGFRIDFDAMAEHLYQISLVAHQHGIAIERVIFDQHLMEKLFSSSRHGAELRHTIPFMKGRPGSDTTSIITSTSEFRAGHFANIAISNWPPVVTLSIEHNRTRLNWLPIYCRLTLRRNNAFKDNHGRRQNRPWWNRHQWFAYSRHSRTGNCQARRYG